MPKFPFKKALIGTGVAGLAGVSGVAGYGIGKRRGAESAAGAMASAFSEANQQENQQLARYFFQKGLQHNPNFKKESSMDKQAALQEIYNESFNDEIEKIAVNSSTVLKQFAAGMKDIGAVPASMRGHYIASGLQTLGKIPKNIAKKVSKSSSGTAKAISKHMKGEGRTLANFARGMRDIPSVPGNMKARYTLEGVKSLGRAPVALSAAGGVGVGGLGVGLMASRRND